MVRAEVRKVEAEERVSAREVRASGRFSASVEREEMCLTSFLHE